MERGQAKKSRPNNTGKKPQGQKKNTARRPAQSRPQKRRRKKNRSFQYLLLFVFCMALGITICMSILFKVEKIVVENNTYYSDQELVSRSGILVGDSLFRINDGDTEKMLEDRFPYIRSIEVKRRLPATIVLDVVEETPAAAIYADDQYVIVSMTGKVLKKDVMTPPGNVPVLLGLDDQKYTVNSYVYKLTEERERVLEDKIVTMQKFLTKCEAQNLGPLTYIDITDSGEIKALYDGRILISFGGEIDLDKKISFIMKVLDEGIAEKHPNSNYTNENFQGTIDITNRKQLHTRPVAVSTIVDQRAFTDFSKADGTAEEKEDTETEESGSEDVEEDKESKKEDNGNSEE